MTQLLRSPTAGRQKRGPEFYWSRIKRLGEAGFTVNELHKSTRGVTRSTVKDYVQILKNEGLIVPVGTAKAEGAQARTATRYAVVKANVAIAPSAKRGNLRDRHRGARQQQLWNSMRLLRDGFTLEALTLHASTDQVEISVSTTRTYVGKLVKAGLVATIEPVGRVEGFRTGFVPATLRLLPSANSGPFPLRIIGDRIFDPNKRDFVGQPLDAAHQEDDASESEDLA